MSLSVKVDNATRANLIRRMWSGGRPNTDRRFAEVYVVLLRAGLDPQQAYAISCVAHDAANGSIHRLRWPMKWLREATLERLATERPRSFWAFLKSKFLAGYTHIGDEELMRLHVCAQMQMEWADWSNHLPPTDAQRAVSS